MGTAHSNDIRFRSSNGLANDVFLQMENGQNDPVSDPGTMRLRYNAATNRWEQSENGGPWGPLIAGGPLVIPSVARPWAAGVDHQLQADAYTGVAFMYSAADAAWVPWLHTVQAFDLYVDPAGNDTASGAVGTPLATPQEAVRRIPPEIRHNVNVYLLDNAGASFVYQGALVVEGFKILPTARLRFIGSTQPAVLASGPNSVAANPANVGDFRSLQIVPDPGWTPGDLRYRKVVFTAGPHVGQDCIILDNTSDTIIFGQFPTWGGPYAPTDAFDILDLTAILQETGAFEIGSLFIGQSSLDESKFVTFVGSQMVFKDLRFDPDTFVGYCMAFQGPAVVRFETCVLNGYDWSPYPTGGAIVFDGSGLFSNQRLWSVTPGNNVSLTFYRTGIYGSMNVLTAAGGSQYSSILGCNFIPNPASTDYAMLHLDSGYLTMSYAWIDGQGRQTPIRLRGALAHGSLAIQENVIIENSPTSGIDGNMAVNYISMGGGSFSIALGQYAYSISPPDFHPDIRGNAEYGINLTGPYRLITFQPAKSTVPNLIGGCRCRRGAYIEIGGDYASEPTISGPLAFDQVDFDERFPSLFYLWGDVVTGLETLCQMWVNHFGVT